MIRQRKHNEPQSRPGILERGFPQPRVNAKNGVKVLAGAIIAITFVLSQYCWSPFTMIGSFCDEIPADQLAFYWYTSILLLILYCCCPGMALDSDYVSFGEFGTAEASVENSIEAAEAGGADGD